MKNLPLLLALLLPAVPSPAAAETRDFSCAPSAVKVDDQKIEILCEEPVVLSERSSRNRLQEVERFAYPMISRNFQPQFGSQVKLLDYYLEVAQNAVLHGRRLHIWFDTDFQVSTTYGCDPTNCRPIVALALTREPITRPLPDTIDEP